MRGEQPEQCVGQRAGSVATMITSMNDSMRNEGSAARDHLANWRTFLAEVRTALGAVALGFAVSELTAGEGGRVRAVALGLVVVGVAVLVGGTIRYDRTRRALFADAITVPRVAPFVLTGVAVTGVVAAVVALA